MVKRKLCDRGDNDEHLLDSVRSRCIPLQQRKKRFSSSIDQGKLSTTRKSEASLRVSSVCLSEANRSNRSLIHHRLPDHDDGV